MFKAPVVKMLAVFCLLLAIGSLRSSAQTNSPPTIAPPNFTAVGQNGQVKLSWSILVGATGYNLWRNSGSGWVYFTTTGTVMGYTDSNLINGTHYDYAINAVNAYGASNFFSYAGATPQGDMTPASAPTNFAAVGQDSQITLSWDLVSDATGYNLWRNTGNGWLSPITLGNVNSYVDSGLINDAPYSYAINATNAFGASSAFAFAGAAPEAPMPTPPAPGPDPTATVIEVPGIGSATSAYLYAVNSSGQIAGNSEVVAGGDRHAFLRSNGTTTDIGTLGGGNSWPRAINSSGAVVGWSNFEAGNWHSRAFVYRNGVISEVGTLGGLDSDACAINDAGQIAGNASTQSGDNHAFLFSNGVMRDLGTLGGTRSYAKTMNSRGQVVGHSYLPNNQTYHSFLYSNGFMQDLGTLGGSTSEASDINERSGVTGYARTVGNNAYHAFYAHGGISVDLGTLGGTHSEGNALNNFGQVVGWSYNSAGVQRAFLTTSGTAMKDLGTLGGSWSTATDINNLGQIVGQAETAITVTTPPNPNEPGYGGYTYKVTHAFLYTNGRMLDLNDLLPPNSGWEILSASSINDAGYVICDGKRTGSTQSSSVILHLSNSNRSPVANDDAVSVLQNSVNNPVLVLQNDSDPDNDSLTISSVTQGSQGQTRVADSFVGVVYTPNANYKGNDSFTYSISDVKGNNATATVNVTITAVNHAPTSSTQSVTLIEDTPKNITLAATDADGDALAYSIVSQPSNGVLSGVAPNFVYTPNANFNGNDSLTFKANDGIVDSNTATVSITVTPVNDAPVATPQSLSVAEDTALPITLSATDADNDAPTFAVVTQPSHGTLSGTLPNLTYTPNANYNGTDSFTCKANDGTLDSLEATININVTPVNDAPTSSTQSVTTVEDTATNITLSATDIDGDALAYSIVSPPTNGVLSGTAPNVVYTPNANYNGSDSFTFKANDGALDSNVANVNIAVTPINDAPISSTQSVTTNEDTVKNITLAATDVDGDALTYSVVTPPANGALSGSGNSRVYKPNLNFNGSDSFTFKANDGALDSNVATVSLTVVPVNDAPVAFADTASTTKNASKIIAVLANDYDVDGDTLSISTVTAGANGTVAISGTSVNFTPKSNFVGTATFSYKISDGKGGTASATVTVTVR